MNKFLIVSVLLASSATLQAKTLHCSVHVDKGVAGEQLKALAKIAPNDALARAQAAFPGKETTVRSSELEAEDGCLVYSFDMVVEGKKGVDELLIDAGDGRILDHSHESVKKEAAERAAEEKERSAKQ